MPKNHPERDLQYEVVERLTKLLVAPAFFAAIVQSGPEFKRFRGYFGKLGVKAGMPDLLIFGPNSKIIGVELKASYKGLSDLQKTMHERFTACGIDYIVCRSWAGVREKLEFEGFSLLSEDQHS